MLLDQPVEAQPYGNDNAGDKHHQDGDGTLIAADTFHHNASLRVN